MNIIQKYTTSAVLVCLAAVPAYAEECCGSGLIPPQPDIIVDAPRPVNGNANSGVPTGPTNGVLADLPPNFGWSVGASVILSILVNTKSASGSF